MTNIKSKKNIIKTTYAQIMVCYPVLSEYKPLAIGVNAELLFIIPDKTIIQSILIKHTSKVKYLQAISTGGSRYHLDGTIADQISDEHIESANLRLADRVVKIEEIQNNQKLHKAALLAKKNKPKPVKVSKVVKPKLVKNHSVMTMQTIAPIVKSTATVIVKKRRFIPPV